MPLLVAGNEPKLSVRPSGSLVAIPTELQRSEVAAPVFLENAVCYGGAVETDFKDVVCEPNFFLAALEVLRKGGQVQNRVVLSSLTAVTPWCRILLENLTLTQIVKLGTMYGILISLPCSQEPGSGKQICPNRLDCHCGHCPSSIVSIVVLSGSLYCVS